MKHKLNGADVANIRDSFQRMADHITKCAEAGQTIEASFNISNGIKDTTQPGDAWRSGAPTGAQDIFISINIGPLPDKAT
jgi:hypothetical protein